MPGVLGLSVYFVCDLGDAPRLFLERAATITMVRLLRIKERVIAGSTETGSR
jgi:hypothetical protein